MVNGGYDFRFDVLVYDFLWGCVGFGYLDGLFVWVACRGVVFSLILICLFVCVWWWICLG